MSFVAVALAFALALVLIAWGLWPRRETPRRALMSKPVKPVASWFGYLGRDGAWYKVAERGNDADRLQAQFDNDWPRFVGKPTDKSH